VFHALLIHACAIATEGRFTAVVTVIMFVHASFAAEFGRATARVASRIVVASPCVFAWIDIALIDVSALPFMAPGHGYNIATVTCVAIAND